MSDPKISSRLRWLWLTLGVILLDRATKAWFEIQTPEGFRQEIIHNLAYLVHSRNPGMAFGILSDSPAPWVRVLLVLGSAVAICAMAWLLASAHTGGRAGAAGLALLLGGAAGNLTDRILHGAVTDFLEIWLGSYHWPAFNVADSAITFGAILVILEMFFGAHAHAAEASRKQAG